MLFEDRKLQKLCTDEREMRKKRGDIAAKLRLRVNALRTAASVGDLAAIDPLAKWHQLHEDHAGYNIFIFSSSNSHSPRAASSVSNAKPSVAHALFSAARP